MLKWADFRGVRLYTKTKHGRLSAAKLCVRTTQDDVDQEIEFDVYLDMTHRGVDQEIEFDVHSLDMSHRDIAFLVEQRGLAAVPFAVDDPWEKADVILREISADLEDGAPFDQVVGKLVKKGMVEKTAARFVSEFVKGRAARHATLEFSETTYPYYYDDDDEIK